MADLSYKLTSAQAEFLTRALHAPENGARRASAVPARGRFPGALPPVANQSVRGTCVANAVAALVACYEGCQRRVSVQYLDEVTRLVEHAWISRNLERLTAGEMPEKDFEAAFPDAVSQAVLLVRANGAGSETASAFVRALGTKMRAHIEKDAGCRLKRCFEALDEYGVCREELWPYSPVALNLGVAGGDAVGAFPPGTHEDARRHRIVNGLYVLRAPNNVDEIKGIISGAQGRRPMPVCLGLDLFEGRTDGEFALPDIVQTNGQVATAQRPLGIHEVLVVGYEDTAKSPGGGHFIFMNSWGGNWGEAGMGRVSYAYVACFCREAGTILQEPGDYGPGFAAGPGAMPVRRRRSALLAFAVGLVGFGALLAVSAAFFVQRTRASRVEPVPPPLPVALPVAPTPVRPKPVPARPVAVQASEDDSFAVERVVDYRFLVRGSCASPREAQAVARILNGSHRDFSVETPVIGDDGCSFEAQATVEGVPGHAPDAVRVIEDYLIRKEFGKPVRKWAVRRLR